MKKTKGAVLLLALGAALAVFAVGASTPVSLGDEVFQYRFARLWYDTGSRPIFDPLIESAGQCPYYFDSDPLWAVGLISLWKLVGEPSRLILQAYHAAFFAGIVYLTYLLACKLVDERTGLYAAGLASSTPFLTAYSVITYLEIPALFLVMLAAYLLLDKRILLAGAAAGLAVLAKRNTALLLPAVALLLITDRKNALRNLVLFGIPVALLTFPEFYFHYKHWHGRLFFPPSCTVSFGPQWMWTPSNIFYNPLSIVQYLGASLLGLLLIYPFVRKNKRQDIFLWLPVVLYSVEWAFFIPSQVAVRYYAPLFGLLCVMASISLQELLARQPYLRRAILIILALTALVQATTSLAYAYVSRQLSPDAWEVYTFLSATVASEERILNPEYTTSLYTERRMIWIGVAELASMFWYMDEAETHDLLESYNIAYIVVNHDRIYDDAELRHRLGFPQSFVQRIQAYDWVQEVMRNEEAIVYHVVP